MNFFHYHYENLLSEDLLLKQNITKTQSIFGISAISLSHSSRNFRIQEKTLVLPWVALELFSGQSPKQTRARQAFSNFKILSRDLVGCKLNIKHSDVSSILSKVYLLVLPRLRGFEGIYKKQIDGKSVTLGLTNLLILPELEENANFFEKVQGIHITIQMTTQTSEESVLILSGFQIPMISN
jgi:large subunit ribosomal protein L5